jgi:selenide,water dikinase
LCKLPKFSDERLLVGVETSDDAAVYKINDEQAIIQTLDFFTPVVDDPYLFGQIAAANSLSDVYAMGGMPTLALNIVGFPTCLDIEILGEILRGGADKVIEAGALLVGGHSINDQEPKYGLSVMGMVHPDAVLKNANAQAGDVLILTKPIGLGILNTCMKEDMLSDSQLNGAIECMRTLNKDAAIEMIKLKPNACTDITGFGLLGHVFEMAEGSNMEIDLYFDQIPVLDGAIEFAEMGIIPAGTYRNRDHVGKGAWFDTALPDYASDLLYDPQTSGGLLISLPEDKGMALMAAYENLLNLPFALVGRVKNMSLEDRKARIHILASEK